MNDDISFGKCEVYVGPPGKQPAIIKPVKWWQFWRWYWIGRFRKQKRISKSCEVVFKQRCSDIVDKAFLDSGFVSVSGETATANLRSIDGQNWKAQ